MSFDPFVLLDVFASVGVYMTVAVTPAEDHFANVMIRNEVVRYQDDNFPITFTIDDAECVLSADGRPFEEPDMFMLECMNGYVAYPQSITLEEGETGIIEIHKYQGV